MTIQVDASGSEGTLTAEQGELRHGDEVVLSGAAPTAESAIDRWLDVCLGHTTKDELVSIADAVTGSNVLAALRNLDDSTQRRG